MLAHQPLHQPLPTRPRDRDQQAQQRRRHHVMSDNERRAIRAQHRQHADWNQTQLAAWATRAFGRPVRQSTISDSLREKYAYLEPVVVVVDAVGEEVDGGDDRVEGEGEMLGGGVRPGDLLHRTSPSVQHAGTPGGDSGYGSPAQKGVQAVDAFDLPGYALSVSFEQQPEQEPDEDIRTEMVSWVKKRSPGLPLLPPVNTAAATFFSVPKTIDPLPKYYSRLLAAFDCQLLSEEQGYCPLYYMGQWLAKVSTRLGRGGPLDDSVQAVSYSITSMTTSDTKMSRLGRNLYGKAIHGLQKQIAGMSTNMIDCDTISSIMIMAIHENLAVTNKDSEANHVRGVGQMMQLLGPEHFCNEYGLSVFLSYRGRIIFDHLTRGTECFLAEQKWRRVPFIALAYDVPQSRSPTYSLSSELYNHMAELTSLQADLRALGALAAGDLSAMPKRTPAQLVQRLFQFKQELLDWYTRFAPLVPAIRTIPAAVYQPSNPFESPPGAKPAVPEEALYGYTPETVSAPKPAYHSTIPSPTINPKSLLVSPRLPSITTHYPFPYYYIHSSLCAASLFSTYLGSLIFINLLLSKLQPLMGGQLLTENIVHAEEICMSADYATKCGFFGPYGVVFGLRMAFMGFGDGTGGAGEKREEKEWIREFFLQMARRMECLRYWVPQ